MAAFVSWGCVSNSLGTSRHPEDLLPLPSKVTTEGNRPQNEPTSGYRMGKLLAVTPHSSKGREDPKKSRLHNTVESLWRFQRLSAGGSSHVVRSTGFPFPHGAPPTTQVKDPSSEFFFFISSLIIPDSMMTLGPCRTPPRPLCAQNRYPITVFTGGLLVG